MAESEKHAKESIMNYITKSLELANQEDSNFYFSEYDFKGWSTDYYTLKVLEAGQVVTNNND